MRTNVAEWIKEDKEKWFNGYTCLMLNMFGELQEYKYVEFDKFNLKSFKNKGYYDLFYSPNTFKSMKRDKAHLLQLRMLWQDLDGIKDVEATIKAIDKLVIDRKIPKYHKIVNSGRGLHIKWLIRDYSGSPRNIKAWESLQRYLYKQLKGLGADRNALDVARVLRVPGTINSKSNTTVQELLNNNILCYDLYELYDQYIYKPYKEHEKVQKKEKNKSKVRLLTSSYNLNKSRLMDLEKLLELRHNEMYGTRNKFLMLYGTYYLLCGASSEATEEKLIELNNIIISKKKASKSEIKTIIRNGEKRALDSKENSNVLPKNETIIEMLQVTSEEQRALKTIIDKDIKDNRRNERKRENRRNEEGLTSREQKKQDLIKKVQKLKAKGLNNNEISEKLNISVRQVQRYKSML